MIGINPYLSETKIKSINKWLEEAELAQAFSAKKKANDIPKHKLNLRPLDFII